MGFLIFLAKKLQDADAINQLNAKENNMFMFELLKKLRDIPKKYFTGGVPKLQLIRVGIKISCIHILPRNVDRFNPLEFQRSLNQICAVMNSIPEKKYHRFVMSGFTLCEGYVLWARETCVTIVPFTQANMIQNSYFPTPFDEIPETEGDLLNVQNIGGHVLSGNVDELNEQFFGMHLKPKI